MPIKAKEVIITPAKAVEMLKKNDRNRPISLKRVRAYANEMKARRWKLNGDSIKFNHSRLIDGQHRLLAIIEARTSIKTLVITGLNDGVFDTIDRGFTRTGGHMLAIDGEVNANNLSAAINTCIRYEDRANTMHMRSTVSTAHMKEFLRHHPRIRDLTQWSIGQRKHCLMSVSTMAALRFLVEKGNVKMSDRFWEKFLSGDNIGKTDPVGLLRKRFIRDKNSPHKLSHAAIISLTIIAWNQTLLGKRAQALQLPKDGRVPTIKRKR